MRIVSLAPSNTEILFALGLGKEIVGVTRFCDYPDDAKYKKKVGGWLDIKLDTIKELKPDLVFTSNFLQAELVEKLNKNGITVVHVDPRNLEQVFESIITIGESVNREDRAAGIVDEMKRRLAKISGQHDKSRKIRVYCEEWYRPTTVSGNWVPELIEIAGGKSFCPKGQKSFEVEVDHIARFNPDVVIISWCGFGRRTDLKSVAGRQVWNSLPAFKKGNVFAVDDTFLNRPGPRLVEGAEHIAEILEKFRQKQNEIVDGR